VLDCCAGLCIKVSTAHAINKVDCAWTTLTGARTDSCDSVGPATCSMLPCGAHMPHSTCCLAAQMQHHASVAATAAAPGKHVAL
jgi:hypothetical protein